MVTEMTGVVAPLTRMGTTEEDATPTEGEKIERVLTTTVAPRWKR
jgi:hypothetical protein